VVITTVDLSNEVVQRNVATIGVVEVGPAIGAKESVPEIDREPTRRSYPASSATIQPLPVWL
jgi:hypothetical protein